MMGSVSLWDCGGDVGICGCVLDDGEDESFGFGVSCVVCVLGLAVGEDLGRVHPLHRMMCSCVLWVCSVCLFVRSRGCFLLLVLGR